jgi:hypothetical protein
MHRNQFTLLKLFARYEPTSDPVCLAYLPPSQLKQARDVQLYRDPACTQPAAGTATARPAPHVPPARSCTTAFRTP